MATKTKLDEILERLRSTQQDLEQGLDNLLAEKREQFQYSLRRGRGKVVFERTACATGNRNSEPAYGNFCTRHH